MLDYQKLINNIYFDNVLSKSYLTKNMFWNNTAPAHSPHWIEYNFVIKFTKKLNYGYKPVYAKSQNLFPTKWVNITDWNYEMKMYSNV